MHGVREKAPRCGAFSFRKAAALVLTASGLALKTSDYEFPANARSVCKGQVIYPADYT